MKIYDQLVEILSDRKNEIISIKEVKQQLYAIYNTKKDSVILSDYCYNRLNKGISFNKHLFIYINKSMYKYVGENFPFTGLIYHKEKNVENEKVVGEWKNGKKEMYDLTSDRVLDSLSKLQIEALFEEYQTVLKKEMTLLNCKPTELRHLIGRIGEFYCALKTGGTLAKQVNQHGFDVESNGRKISVKTTAQVSGFIPINIKTFKTFDDLFIVQYINDDFQMLYHGPKEDVVPFSRVYEGKYEVDIGRLKKRM